MRKISLATLLVLTMVTPTPVVALGTVHVEDTIAGISSQAEIQGVTTGSAHLHLLTPVGEDIAIPVTVQSSSATRISLPADLTTTAGTYRAVLRSGRNDLTGTDTFDVLPGRVDARASTIDADTATLIADGVSEVVVTVTLTDAFGNALAGRPVEVLSNRTDDHVVPLNRDTDEHGQQHVAIRTTRPGAITVRAMDLLSGITLQESAHITASDARGVGGFTSDLSQYTPDSGTPRQNSLVAQVAPPPDANDNVDDFEILAPADAKVKDFVSEVSVVAKWKGTVNTNFHPSGNQVYISSPTDDRAEFPLEELLDLGDGKIINRGTLTFDARSPGRAFARQSIKFNKTGTQTLRVEYTREDGMVVRSDVTIDVVGSTDIPSSRLIEVLAPRANQKVGDEVTIQGIGPRYRTINVFDVTDGDEELLGSIDTDAETQFSKQITLPDDRSSFVLKLRDSTEEYESPEIPLQKNRKDIPVEVTFSPSTPHEGDAITATVKSKPGLEGVSLEVGEEFLTLSEGAGGSYSVLFASPEAGEYPYTVLALADDESTGEATGTLTVRQPELTKIQNLQAEPGRENVTLRWDPLAGDHVTSYVVYVGTDPENFSEAKDTGSTTGGAVIDGLKPGMIYYFAVTAKTGDEEGPTSDILAATTLGWKLTIKPRPRALLLEYDAPGIVSVEKFLFQFWIDPRAIQTLELEGGEFTEKNRTQSYLLQDLIDTGLTYYIRLTPIVRSTADDGAATLTEDPPLEGKGVPLRGNGFDPASSFDPRKLPPNDRFLDDAPGTTQSGIPLPGWMALGASLLGFLLFLHHRRRALRTHTFMRQMQRRYRNN